MRPENQAEVAKVKKTRPFTRTTGASPVLSFFGKTKTRARHSCYVSARSDPSAFIRVGLRSSASVCVLLRRFAVPVVSAMSGQLFPSAHEKARTGYGPCFGVLQVFPAINFDFGLRTARAAPAYRRVVRPAPGRRIASGLTRAAGRSGRSWRRRRG